MMDDTKKNNQLVKAKTSSLQRISSNIVSRGLSDLALLDIEKAKITDECQAREWLETGEVYRVDGEYDKAIKAFTSAIALNPNYATAYEVRGLAYREKGQYDRAIEDYNKAIQINPDYPFAYTDRGCAYYEKGQYDRAIDDYNKAIQINPAYPHLMGIDYNNKLIQKDPNDRLAYLRIARTYRLKEQYDRAIEDYNKMIVLRPQHRRIYSYRGIAYYKKGLIDKAISDFQKACD